MISITGALASPASPPPRGPHHVYAALHKNVSQGRDYEVSTQRYFPFPQTLDRRISANESVDFGMPDENYTEYAEIPHYIKATSMAFCIAIMCLGVIGNVMVPIVILKTKDMRNSTNIFLVNLSIADLMVLLVCTPTVLVEVNSKPETWVLGKELCLAVPFVELTVAHASVLTILAISFERYYAICEPLRAGYVCTKTRAALICALAWFFAALFTSPVLAIAEHRYVDRGGGRRDAQCLTQAGTFWPILFYITIIVFLFLLPLVILVILYSIIAKNLITAASKVVMNKTVDPSNSRARKQVILMLGTVVLCFFVCLIPFRVLVLWIIVAPTEHLQEMSPEKYYNLLYFSRIMLYINSAINPILYNLMSSKFRIGFCKMCVCCKNSEEREPNRRARRKRAGTVTTGSTTSSSLTRTTDSLKKLFRNRGLDRCNTTKSDTENDSRNAENMNDDKIMDPPQNNFLSRIFRSKRFIRQQSAPVRTGNVENHRRSRIMSEGDILERPASSVVDRDYERMKVDGDVTRKPMKLSDFNDSIFNEMDRGQGSLRRSVLINSAKARNIDEHTCNDDGQKTRVCMVAFKKTRSINYDLPESFV